MEIMETVIYKNIQGSNQTDFGCWQTDGTYLSPEDPSNNNISMSCPVIFPLFNITMEDLWKLRSRMKIKDGFKRIMNEMNIYVTPIIIIVGITGNMTSFLVFAFTHLRRNSSSVYLASLAVVDTAFLLSLLVVWLGWIKIRLFHVDGWCQTVLYVNHVCQFLSVWYVVGFTAERYIIVWYPLRKDRYCTTRRAKQVVICLTVFAFTVYSYATWTSGVMSYQGFPACMPFPQYYDLLTVLTSVDTILALIVPSFIIVILNVRIIIKIHQVQKQRAGSNSAITLMVQNSKTHRRSALRASVSSKGSMRIKFSATDPENEEGTFTTNPEKVQTVVAVRGRSQYRFARMLLIVSSIFVVLNIPSHFFKIQAFVQSLFNRGYKGSKVGLKWQEFFQLIYYFNFSINFFLYSACGRPFRSGLRRLWGRVKHKVKTCSCKPLSLHKDRLLVRRVHWNDMRKTTRRSRESNRSSKPRLTIQVVR